MLTGTALSETIVSRRFNLGILAEQFQGIYEIFDRDAIGLNLGLRVPSDHERARVSVVFSQVFLADLQPAALGIEQLGKEDLLLACALARVGDFVDEFGLAEELTHDAQRVEVRCLSEDFEAWRERKPAGEQDVTQYLAAKVYWAWRYDQPSAVIATSDEIRLRLPWRTINRMAQLGDNIQWRRDPGSRFFLPERDALREYHAWIGEQTSEQNESLIALLSAPRYEGPRSHWQKARGFLEASSLDPANAAKEAICAVEGLLRLVLSQPSATLGELIKDLKTRFRLDGGMAKSLEGLWGYTSNAPGVRHGAPTEIDISMNDARYVVNAAEAILQFVLSLDKEARRKS